MKMINIRVIKQLLQLINLREIPEGEVNKNHIVAKMKMLK